MTSTEAHTDDQPGTDLEPVLAKGRIALSDGKSVQDVARAMLPGEAQEAEADAQPPLPGAPKQVVLTDDVKRALAALSDVFAVVQPLERRSLSVEEMKQVHVEREVLKAVKDLFTSRDEDLKEIIRNHLDVVAEDRGDADPERTQRDTGGHYVIASKGSPDYANIPGTDRSWSREFRAGTMSMDTSVLDQMEADGEISREVYLAMTQERRVFNENKALLAAGDPRLRDGVLAAIRKMTVMGRPGTSLFTRKAK